MAFGMPGAAAVLGGALLQGAVTGYEAYQLAQSSYQAYQDGAAANEYLRARLRDALRGEGPVNSPPKITKRRGGNLRGSTKRRRTGWFINTHALSHELGWERRKRRRGRG